MPTFPGTQLISRFFGRTVSEGAAYALGVATGPALRPLTQEVTNEAWSLHPVRPPDVGTLAVGVAQGQVDPARAREWAAETGIGGEAFDALVSVADTGPGVSAAFDLWRRGVIDEAGFRRACKRQGLEREWIDDFVQTKIIRLSAPVIALGIVRGLIHDPGFLPVAPPAAEGKVPAYPVSNIDALTEAEASGWDRERLGLQVGISGRPMGPEAAANAVFRGILERVDYDRAISEGDVRNEWADSIFEATRQIATASTYVTAHLKGWIDEPAMYAGTARHGMSRADTQLMFLAAGRPAAPQQMATAWARGVDGPDGRPMDEAQFLKGIAQSNIRPEWGPMLWGIRYAYPPLFQIGRLVTGGQITPEQGADWARKNRYAPEVVEALLAAWGGTATPHADPHIAKAQTQLWSLTHRAYVEGEAERDEAAAALTTLAIPADAQTSIFHLWDVERGLKERQLTPTQVKKLYGTGKWTRDQAFDRLTTVGYSPSDANDFLDL